MLGLALSRQLHRSNSFFESEKSREERFCHDHGRAEGTGFSAKPGNDHFQASDRAVESSAAKGMEERLQEKALGGLKPATLRLLERIADDAAARRQASPTPEKILLSAGTVLIRQWHGTKHQVTVAKDGFLYHAKRFHSLSQIARTITGSRWSGPLFFGLKSPRKEQSSEAA